ncbi:sigma-70 family RNA polymerase sigma factor [Paenibacillus sp. ACRRX]|uniref:sigma-70 family RNA polymerase sigma factor n=1 Tax=Paenibacillus sp. ACRRX TaxID=2918206 RepID=UPI001EF40865|nr:sigma-70 family RNA polymerase sigma factor [Paenibacillus sp. ACRRX]MCG7407349.1 sigma-70 family RNA polymerase sigma factor [Paenibacillus sp. ACRRX]
MVMTTGELFRQSAAAQSIDTTAAAEISTVHDTEEEKQTREESELVRLAQLGDRSAFGELVRRHRQEAFRWARQITKQDALAEDIVQDALLKAFLHVGSVTDASRFVPWLHRIVRNQAYTKLRRGGPYAKETPVSYDEAPPHNFGVDCANVESIARHVASRQAGTLASTSGSTASESRGNETLEKVMRGETAVFMVQMLQHLKPKERRIFEAHFFEQLAPAEIAELLQVSTGVIYTSIHRSKAKLQQQVIRSTLRFMIHERKEHGLMKRKVLDAERYKQLFRRANGKPCAWSSAGLAMYGMLSSAEPERNISLHEVMGLSSLPFRLQVKEGTVDIAGPTAYDWQYVFRQGMQRCGAEIRVVGTDCFQAPTADQLSDALRLITESVDKGVPVMVWDMHVSEFGLIYGYDDKQQVVYAIDPLGDGPISYEQLGRRQLGELFVAAYRYQQKLRPVDTFRMTLQDAVRHLRGEDWHILHFTHGLEAYTAWVHALRSGTADVLGNAYQAATAADDRSYAAQFFSSWVTYFKSKQQQSTSEKIQYEAWMNDAACLQQLYDRAGQALLKVAKRFPFPTGGNPRDPIAVDYAVADLTEAQDAEREAAAVMQELIYKMERSLETKG